MSHIQSTLAKQLLDIGPDRLEEIRAEAREKGLDSHSFVAAQLLGKDINEVTTIERNEAKTLLFALNYGGMGKIA
jgi:DNA polymerase I-like protein with 3'-5' exonuclease and polymerase domains